MLGVLANSLTVILGTVIGLLFRKIMPKKLGDAVMIGVALCTLYIGVDGMLEGDNAIITVLSVALGAVIGTLLDLDGLFQRFGAWMEARFSSKKQEDGEAPAKKGLAEGFVSSTLLFCVGAMAVVGSLNAGFGDNSTLYAKAVIDGITAIFFASSLGLGVMLSSASLFVYQGAIALLAGLLKDVLSEAVIAEMTCVGSLLLIALALNLLGLTKIKLMNYLPAIFLPILFCLFL